MTAERWRQIEALYRAAQECGPADRAALLEASDPEVRSQVERMLAQPSEGEILDSPAADLLEPNTDSLVGVGSCFGPYKIEAVLGAGGMGTVYRAVDTRLGRAVALKVAAARYSERFEREAKAISALNHPHICTLYDVGPNYLVMELVEGQTLAEQIKKGPLEPLQAARLGAQIAGALAEAHAHGIVHRDLKPSNIMITRHGAKVLDFGLAKRLHETRVTEANLITGTALYMAPERMQGGEADARSDLFALGLVLYEMAAGKLPLPGVSLGSAWASGATTKIPPLSGRSFIVKRLNSLISNLLERDPERRPASAVEVRERLEMLAGERGYKRVLTVAALLALVAVAAVGIWWSAFHRGAGSPQAALKVTPLTSDPGDEPDPSFSPDGNQVAFAWKKEQKRDYDIYVKLLGSGQPLRLTDNPADEVGPAWSPDGRRIAFYRCGPDETAIYSVSPLGGSERKLVALGASGTPFPCLDTSASQLAWSPDGKFLAFEDEKPSENRGHVFLLSLDTGETRRIVPDSKELMCDIMPAFSPDGRTLAFVGQKGNDSADIYLIPVTGGERMRLTFDNRGVSWPAWTPDGRELVFSSFRTGQPGLWRIPVSGGTPKQLAWAGEGVPVCPAISPQRRRLVFERFFLNSNIYRAELPSSKGERKPATRLIASTWEDANPYYSPDGKRVVFASDRSGFWELWVCNSDGSNLVQLTSLAGPEIAPWGGWSPDGKLIACNSNLRGSFDIYVANAESGALRRLTTHPGVDARGSWSPDGRWIYFRSNRTGTNQVWKVSVQGGDPVQVTKMGGQNPMVARDGKFVYYSKGAHTPGIWRVPAEGGKETLIVPECSRAWMGNWNPVEDGIYFADWEESEQPSSLLLGPTKGWIKLWSFATHKVTNVLPIGTPWDASTLAISPDGRSFLYPQIDSVGGDLMLVENFR